MADPTPVFNPADVDRILREEGGDRERILYVLRAIQERYNYLPEAALRRAAEAGSLTPADLEGVSTFYASFRRLPAGRHRVRVCVGTACFVKGAENVYDAFRLALKIRQGADTDRDGLFTVEKVACLGCCTLAPVVQIDEVVYGRLSRQQVPAVLRDFLNTRDLAAEEPETTGATDAAMGAATGGRGTVALCTCSSCRAAGAGEVLEAFRRGVRVSRLAVDVRRCGCSGIAYRAPIAEVTTPTGERLRYAGLTPAEAPEILFRHFRAPSLGAQARWAASRLVERLLAAGGDDDTSPPLRRLTLDLARGPDGAFWAPQVRVVSGGGERLDPLDLDAYLAAGGFAVLRRCLQELGPQQVIAQVKDSGLRGRGGAGYPTGRKWEEVRRASGEPRYLVCNADEGDPGAFMDRMTLESFPFRVIEGMAIAAYAVGARQGLFFVRTEYPLAIRRVGQALAACAARGILGERVLGLPFAFSIRLEESAGAFVCGEETAMIAALEGRRGHPRARPPYPAQLGLWGRPTLVNNVETLAAVPWILDHGPEEFRAMGTPRSPGTKTFALAGKILRGGLIEVPMGISIRRIVEEIGGGIQEGRRFKAVQIGGPSGGCIPEALSDLPVDFESLTGAGAMMGSGVLVVLDETDCMVDVARYFMGFTQGESCGKCTCCRVGTRRMLELLTRLCAGEGKPGDLERLEELAGVVREGSLCGLGRSAPNPVLSTLRYFRAEYEAHLAGRCPAGRCKALIAYTITDDCIGCTRCAQACPAEAIAPRPYEKHRIDAARCIRCGTCRQVCPSEAVRIVPRAELPPTDDAAPAAATGEAARA